MRSFLVLVLLSSTLACSVVEAEIPAYVKTQNSLAKRVDGLDLRIEKLSWNNSGDLLISWALNYQGRSGVQVLEPSLKHVSFSQTHLTICLWSPEGRHQLDLYSPSLAGKYFAPREWFVSVNPNAGGEIRVSRKENWGKFAPPLPEGFQAERVWVQLLHKPWDRGEAHDLNAWTGQIYSQMVSLTCREF